MIGDDEYVTRSRNHMDCWSGDFQCVLDDKYCPMAPKKEYVTWYGRWRSIFVDELYMWLPEKIPVGLTPWNWVDMPWNRADMWLPHRPIRGRGHKSKRPAPM